MTLLEILMIIWIPACIADLLVAFMTPEEKARHREHYAKWWRRIRGVAHDRS
jgi:hypothetical protein